MSNVMPHRGFFDHLMGRWNCPACGTSAGVREEFSRTADSLPWYKMAAVRQFCNSCGAQVQGYLRRGIWLALPLWVVVAGNTFFGIGAMRANGILSTDAARVALRDSGRPSSRTLGVTASALYFSCRASWREFCAIESLCINLTRAFLFRCMAFPDAGHKAPRRQRPLKTSGTPSANTLPSSTSNCEGKRFAKSRWSSSLAEDSRRQSPRCRPRSRNGRVFSGAPRQAHRHVQRRADPHRPASQPRQPSGHRFEACCLELQFNADELPDLRRTPRNRRAVQSLRDTSSSLDE